MQPPGPDRGLAPGARGGQGMRWVTVLELLQWEYFKQFLHFMHNARGALMHERFLAKELCACMRACVHVYVCARPRARAH